MIHHALKRKSFLIFIPVFALLIGSAILSSCYYDNEQYLYPTNGQSNCDTLSPTYAINIALIFANNCNGCHNPTSPSGNIVTDNYAALSLNIDKVSLAINHLPGAEAMPKDGEKLSTCDLATIKQWRNLGMPEN